MPMKPITVKANFQLDTSAARAQLQGLQRELNGITKSTTSQLGVTQQITEAIKAAELLKQTLAEATNINTGTLDLAKFTTSMRENMTSIEQMKKSLQTLGPEGEKAFNSLAMNIATAQVPLQRTSELFGQFKTAISNAMKWQVSSMAIHKVTAEISKAFNYAKNLDKSLTNIQIVTGHNADYMAKFAQNANKAAQALSASTLEYTNASLIYYQQGLGDKEVAKRAETTLKLAKVTGESASKVSQQMTAVWNNFSNGVDNLERYADVMTALGATTASSSSEIAKGLEKFASVTKTIGLSYDYAASALATVTAQTRQSADSVGTAFKTLFSRLESLNLGETLDDSTTLNKYSEALLKIGVNVMDVNGNLKNMDGILDELGGKWNSLNKAQQVALAQTVGGVRNYTSLITLMDNWQDFQNNIVTSQLAEGTLQKQADIYAKSWEAAQQRVTTAAQGIYDTLISSDFFKGVNNVTAFALNGVSGLGRALGTSGSLAGLSMLINSVYKENLTTGINNLGNNILANTAYGQNQAIQIKNSMLEEFTKDLSFQDKSLDPFRQQILKAAQKTTDQFYEDRKNLPTKAAQQAYVNAIMQTNAEGISALSRLSDVDNYKNIDSQMLRARTGAELTGLSRKGKVYRTAAVENILNAIDTNGGKRALGDAFMDQFGKNMLEAIGSPEAAAKLKEQVRVFNTANMDAIRNNTQMGRIVGSIIGVENGKTLDPSVFKFLQDYIQTESGNDSVALNKAIEAEVKQAGYDINSKAGQKEIERVTSVVKEYQGTQGKWKAEEILARYHAQANIDKQGNLKGTLTNMMTQSNGLLSVKQHYKLDEKGNPIVDKNGQRVMEDNQTTMGAFTLQTAQMVNSLAMAANSITSFGQAVREGNVSFSNYAAVLGSTGLAIGQTLSLIHNNSALMNFMGGAAGQGIAGKITNSKLLGGLAPALTATNATTGVVGLSTLGAGSLAALAAVAGYIGVKVVQGIQAQGIDARISRSNEDKIQANSRAKEDKQLYDNFRDVVSKQNESYGKLYNLQQGTANYTSQLIASNEQARQIIDTYNLKANQYSIDENGAFYFTAQQTAQLEEALLEASAQSSVRASIANSKVTEQTLYRSIKQAWQEYYGMKNPSGSFMEDPDGIERIIWNNQKYTREEFNELQKENFDKITEVSTEAVADYQMALSATLSGMENVTDKQRLAVQVLGNEYKDILDHNSEIYGTGEESVLTYLEYAGTIRDQTRKFNGQYKSLDTLRAEYDELFGNGSVNLDWTQEQLASAIESKKIQNWLEDQINSQNLDASAVSKYANYSSISVNKLLDEVIRPNQDNDNYKSLNLMALNKIAGSQETLAQALFNNTNISDMNFATMADQMQQQLHLSVEQTENLANYINNFGTNFGDATGQAVLSALTGYDATTGRFGASFNTDFYKELQNISTASSIAGLADLEKRIGMVGNREVADQMRDLQKAMMADIDSRGGLAKTLFESSDFQDTFAKLSDVFQATGHITAQNIADLAAKNETLNGYLEATASQSPMSGAQAVADIASLLASGSITTSDLTPAVAAFIEEASGTGRGSQQEAVDEAEEARKNLSDSITDTDKFYQEGGKLWYNAIKNDALLDAPMQEWFAQVLKPKDLEAINTIFNLGVGHDTDWMVKQIKTKIPEVYDMMTVLQGGTSKKKAGKGGGGLDTYLAYLGSDSFLNAAGIKIEDNGRITFPGMPEGKSFEELYKEYMDQRYPDEKTHYMTENGMYEFVNDYLLGQGMSKSQASFVATQFVGRSSSSSLGTVYQRNGILAGTDKLIEQLEKENGGSVTRAGIDALYDQYAAGMAGLWINPETGKIEALSDEQLAAGTGGIDRDQFRTYIAQELRSAGKAFIDASGLGMYGKSTDIQSIGKELADLSEGTIFGTGADAIVDAAVKYGVKRYRVQTPGKVSQMGNGAGVYEPEPPQMLGEAFDYNELQDFYTNVLGLSVETFQQHLPDIMASLTANSTFGGTSRAALNYQYKDIFGAIHNINSSDAKYWSGEEFNVEQYNQDINTEKQKSEWDDFQNQKFMEEAYEEAYKWNQEHPDQYKDPYKLYQEKIAAEKERRQAEANNTVNAYETNGTVNVEGNFTQEQQDKIDNLKRQREASIKYGHWDEVREFDRQIAELEGTMPLGTQGNITGQTGGLSAWDTASKEEKAGFVYSSRADAADIFNYWKQHPGMTQAQAYDDVVILGKKPEPPTDEETTPTGEETTPTGEETTPTYGTPVSDNPYGTRVEGVSEEYQAFKESGLTREQWDAYKASGKTLNEYKASTLTLGTTFSDNPYGTRVEVEGITSEEYQAFKESGLTREQWNAYKTSGKTLDEYKASTLTLGTTFSENPYGTKVEGVSEEYQAFKESGLTREQWNDYKASGKTLDEYKAEKAAAERLRAQINYEERDAEEAELWQAIEDKKAREAAEKAEQTAREQAALVDVNNLINEANKIEPTILGPNGEVISGPGAEEAARTAMMTPSQYETYKAQQENIKKAAESLGISTEEASKYINSGFNGSYDAYKQYSNIATFNSDKLNAQQRLDFINATYEKAQKDITSLTPFEKQVLTMIGEIDENTGTLVEHGEEEAEDAATRAKNGKQINDEGEVLDEEGNPIEFDENGNPTGGGGGNGRGPDTGGPGGRGNGGNTGPKTPDGLFAWKKDDGSIGFFGSDGTEYVPGAGGDYIPVLKEPESNPAANNSIVACFSAGTQILMADKTTKNIEDIQIDEIIISYDEKTQQFIPKKVIKFDAHTDTPIIVKLTFDNGNILKLTPSHPLLSTFGWKSLDIENAFRAHGVLTTLLQIGDIILGFEKEASVVNIEYLTDQLQYNTYNIDIEDCHTYLANGFIAHNKAASGQNNARLLAYASGREGHIAVTGELGPELRVKSDGSMDILGKKGREYAWIEPDDRIYTAFQSASILKSNKIPALEGLAKGINNFIPGYAGSVGGIVLNGSTSSDQGSSGSSGGSGGGGGGRGRGGGGDAGEKDPRYDPKTLKIRDVLERYYTILQQIDNITKAVERFSKVADRAWGRERIRAIEHQNELQQKQYEAQKKYIAEIEGYLETDQSAMTTMIREFVEGWNKAVDENTDPNNTMEKISWAGAQFDQDGVLTNYRDFVEKLVEQYNQNAASANQEVQYKFQEQLKDIQMYTDTLNLYEEQINALEDIKNAILDTAIKVVSYEVEYKLELSGDTDRILNFQADKYKDDVYQAAKYLELLDQRADLTRKNLETVTEGIMKTLGNYAGENMRVGALHTLDELGVYGTNKFEIPEELLEELDEDDEEDAEKLKELQAERSRNITKQIGAWLEEAYATNKDEVEKIEKMLSFSSEEGAGDFTYDEDWRDTYDSWEDYYNEVINKTDNDTERFIDNYEEIIGRLNGLVDFQKIRTQVSDWLEELRTKDAEAAMEIDKIIRYTEDGQIANYSDVLEKLNEANVKLNDEFINLLYTDQEAFFKAMSDFQNNPGWVDFTTEHKDQLTNWMDAIYQYLESLQDTYEQTIEQLGDSIKATAKQMDAAVDEFDYYGDVYKTFGNIVDLTNRHMTDVSQDFFNTLNNKSMDNSINKIKATVTNYHLLQNELAEVTKQYNEMQARANAATGEEQIYLQQSADKLKEQLDIANNQYEDAHKAFLSSWEDALSKMAENYKAAVEEAAKNFEQGFSPLFNTLALLQAQFDREKALGDLYVDNYQRIHDLNKLNRDIQLSIDDTDNLKGKERLRDLQAEINQLQEDGTELSEYDLDILDKKYKLELARQALEDAKDAKSMVRLARDNNGNWSYVYTANQDDVDKAEQDYEDAIREMEQANEDYIDNIQDQILQVQQEAQQAILALQPEDFATYEDYLAAVNNIQNSMYQTLDFLRSQLNNAFGNNEWLDPYIVDRYGINDHDLTTDFGDTTLAGLLDNPDIDKAIKKAKENFEDNLKQPVLDAFIEYSERQDEVYQAAEHDIATIGKDFQDEMESIADSSEYQVEVVANLFERVQNSFNDMAAVVDEKTKKHLDEATMLVDVYEKLVEAITKVKELSGENLPIEGGQFIGKIDSWAEIQRLNKELAEHGDYRTLEDLTELEPEDLQDRKDAMQKASEKIGKWMETLLVDSVDEETRTAIQDMVERDEDGLITNYKQVISKLAQLEKTDENKDTLKEIKKWRATEQKAMYTSPQQVYKENEGLYTNFIAGDQFTKDYLSWITDQLMYNQMKTVSDSGVTDTEKAEIETYLGAHGGVWVKKGDTEEFFDSLEEWKAWYEDNKKKSGGGGGETGNAYSWGTQAFSKGDYDGGYSSTYWGDTGGYTGRWQSADTGMYTGEWPGGSIRRNGRLAWLHQKELILNAHDTENFLDAMEIVRQLDNLTNWMANGLGDLIMPKVTTESGELEQNVHIEAEFPNVTDHNEIEQAFNNLVNMASQYANRK